MSPEQERERQIVQKLDTALGLIREAYLLAIGLEYGEQMLNSICAADDAVRVVLEDLS